ncbi:MAG TPA: peptide deformylase [Candidatus Saccharicenans sp.]|nr:peptide deformylase [Candidatus Saccharicenans sp.]HOT68282.1 peptide deformylase [Candidatus Saccharicenans sp.]HPC87283.1 peptide deformylase [Candidatus Saccharicenans sp.]HPP23276.1 peptide deformylase [Candidatus Saccharicenans sp.]HQE63749.1 peptide deformylase [Candidatus Saccharicenans sp.]
MAILEILKVGHPLLAQKARPVENINQEIVDLARDMVETMYRAPGVGLAAPQVNRGIRLITVDLSVGENKDELFILINPEIVEESGKTMAEEGCLSVPGIYEKLERPERVVVKGYDLNGREITIEASDLLARAFAHEIDHLEGKLFIDRLSPLKKSLIKNRIKKEQEKVSTR